VLAGSPRRHLAREVIGATLFIFHFSLQIF
jgi:hypothetical protein